MTIDTMSEIINNCSTAIISSIDKDGFQNTKAMLPPRKRIGLKEFYFTTNTSSLRVQQYRNNSKACIYFYDNKIFKGFMIVGNIEVLEDEGTKNMIWRDGDDAYYPKGITDPDYCVLRFTGFKVRTYHSFMKEEIII